MYRRDGIMNDMEMTMSILLARCFGVAALASSLIALAQASPVEDDAALMARLRAQVMAIPEDRREEDQDPAGQR